MAGSRGAVERAIANELARHGANRVAIAGILGNAWRESRLDPTAEGTGGGGLWGFTSGAISLANLKRAGGGRWSDPTFQTDFMLAHGGQGLISKLNSAKTPAEAARLFMEDWERPGIPALAEREAGARYSYRQLAGFVGAPRPPKASSKPAEPSSSESQHSSGGGLGSDLMHVGMVGALVLGGAGLVGLGVTRVFGSAQRRSQAA
jgi:Phage tail lysozyme